MISKLACLAITCTVLHGCEPAKKSAYQRVADELNPIYATLVPKVAVIQRLGPSASNSDSALAAACAGADAELQRIRAIRFDEAVVHPSGAETTLASVAGTLLTQRHAICTDLRGTKVGVSGNCRWWCLDRWAFFTEVSALYAAAAKVEGVNVLPMPRVMARPTLEE